MFYPADPRLLAFQVDKLIDTIEVPADDVLAPAYVVPHTGYRYSGPTAAHVYARLRVHAAAEPDPAGTVVLCSTDLSHYLPQAQAREQDRRTLQAVFDLRPEVAVHGRPSL